MKNLFPITAVLLFSTSSAVADLPPCFPIDQAGKPLSEKLKTEDLKKSPKLTISGANQEPEYSWAEILTTVPIPITSIIPQLRRTTENFKDAKNQDLTLTEQKITGALWAQKLKVEMTVAVFVSIDWTEDWRIYLLDGKPDHPKKIMLRYEKIEGTSHIERFCGSMVLEQKNKNETILRYSEEINAPSRPPEDVLKSMLDTIDLITKAAALVASTPAAAPSAPPAPSNNK